MIKIFDNEIVDTFFRASPLFMNVFMFSLTWILGNHDYLYFFICLLSCDALNHLTKNYISNYTLEVISIFIKIYWTKKISS